ncbi:TIGR03086 family metal-binding protein [Actinoplanes sp. NBRC 103695]|uniref:TIGR03086 family metal-binding protein n=1 Tax=Actinoplanes sp. NBRC 103695 TaxID=3032202 RepID=UPI0024A0E001|nr:TIGR03086 family metal-binding protein [Actinoplanes sp. NBRC 103695]GLY94268.1 TIGR03086 family protein [Actinoplanes sp. NBRC 103695]
MPIDLLQADAAAVRATVDLTHRAAHADLARPTPCSGWDLRALLAHMTVQHEGFAAAAVGRGHDEAVWRQRWQDPQPFEAYAVSAAVVLSAFEGEGVLDRPFHLPEIRPEPIPGRFAVGFHLVDYLAHGWDVAATLGLPWSPPPDALAVALPIAREVPDDEGRTRPGAAFGPGIPVPPDAPAEIEFLGRLGRSAAWRPETVGPA